MKRIMAIRAILLTTLSVLLFFSTGSKAQDIVAAEVFEGWMQSLSNWGRWGDDDELGTLNLITPETRMKAAKLVQTGISVSMAHELLIDEAEDNNNPFDHRMTSVGSSPGPWAGDFIGTTYHGYAHSHLDALCHRFQNGVMYNGYSENEVTEEGCARLSITAFKDGIFGRGILIDVPRMQNVDWIEPGVSFTAELFDAWEEQTGISIQSGDIVLIRTGRWARRDSLGPWNVSVHAAGVHASAVEWFKARDISVIGSDDALDVAPTGVETIIAPTHALFLVALGTPILDNLDLEALAEEAARQGRWEFLFTTAPLRVVGGTGSPLNPIATF